MIALGVMCSMSATAAVRPVVGPLGTARTANEGSIR